MPPNTRPKANPGLKTYLLKDVPPNLWKRIKIQAVQQDKLMKDWVLEALKSYLKNSTK